MNKPLSIYIYKVYKYYQYKLNRRDKMLSIYYRLKINTLHPLTLKMG